MKITVLVAACLVFLSFGRLAAEENQTGVTNQEQEQESKLEKPGPASPGEQKVIAKLAEQFDVDEQVIIDTRMQGYGYGEISHALVISQKSGKPLEEIIALRDSGMGWGEIAKKYDLNLGKITKESKDVQDDIQNDISPRVMNEKPVKLEKLSRPGMPPKPEKPAKPIKPAKLEKPVKPEKPNKPSRP